MVKLETVEDFEKVRKALEDPKSSPRDYSVCPYSYCCHCDEVREFEAPCVESWGELINVKCLDCGKMFFVTNLDLVKSISWGRQSETDKIPEQFKGEIKKLNSREMQKNFFSVALEKRIGREKSELRKVQNRIQELARLRA